jgi:hypothetical protein
VYAPNFLKNGASITAMMTKPARPPMTRQRASNPMRKNTPVMATMPVAPMVALALPRPV